MRLIALLPLLGCLGFVSEPFVPVPPPNAAAALRPNILLVVADDLGLDKVGVYDAGDDATRPLTPQIDGLAARGLTFRRAYVNPTCSPTRAAMLTGRYGFRTGLITGLRPWRAGKVAELSPVETALPALLADSGYHTAHLGKWHLGSASGAAHPTLFGWDHFAGTRGNLNALHQSYTEFIKNVNGEEAWVSGVYATTDTTDDAIKQMQQMREPWFTWVSYHAPHTPFHVPPTTLHGRDPNEIGEDEVELHRAMTEALDSEFGRLLAALDPRTRARTTVILIGDNGTTGAAVVEPLRPDRAKGTLYQSGVNVPLIVSGYGVSRDHLGESSDALIGAVDLFSTILDLARVPETSPVDGISFVPVLRSPATSVRAFAYAETGRNERTNGNLYEDHEVMATDGRYKLIRAASYADRFLFPPRFYDLDGVRLGREGRNLCGVQNCPGVLTPEQRDAYRALNRFVDDLLELRP